MEQRRSKNWIHCGIACYTCAVHKGPEWLCKKYLSLHIDLDDPKIGSSKKQLNSDQERSQRFESEAYFNNWSIKTAKAKQRKPNRFHIMEMSAHPGKKRSGRKSRAIRYHRVDLGDEDGFLPGNKWNSIRGVVKGGGRKGSPDPPKSQYLEQQK